MKLQKVLLVGLAVLAVMAASLIMNGTINAATDEHSLKEACIKATIQGIEMEIKNYEFRIEAAQKGPGDASNIPGFKKRIEELKADLEKYRAMKPENYTLPEKKTVTITVRQSYQEGSLLDLVDMTKSGPFYHFAGIKGDDYSILKPGQTYTFTVYLVYKRDYVLPWSASYYVYADCGTMYSINQHQTGEVILNELIIKPNTVTIRVASGGCTDKSSFRVDVKKEEGFASKTPHYVLTFYRVKPDDCKALMHDGVLLTFDLNKDLGLSGAYTVSVANPVYLKALNK